MTKSLTAKLYGIGFVVWLIGIVIVFATVTSNASHQVGAGAVLGYSLAALGGIAMLVGWIMALVITGQARRWGWFIALLVLGLIGLQIIVMAAYLIAGPRENQVAQGRPATA